MLQVTNEDIVRFLQQNSTTKEVILNGKEHKLTFIESVDYEKIAQQMLNKLIYPPS